MENNETIDKEDVHKFSCYKKNRRFTINQKKEAIQLAKLHNNAFAANKLGVSTKSIRRWHANEDKYNTIKDAHKRITLHKGVWVSDYEIEKKIYDWICYNRSLGNVITTWAVAIEFIKLNEKYKSYKPKSLYNVVYRFLSRFSLSIRSASHIGQQLPKDSTDRIISFLKEIINLRKLYDIKKENIINLDETALQYNMPFHKTIHKIGAKTITIKTQRQEKSRISLILSIAGDGSKLIPYVIFKGAKEGKIIKSLKSTSYVKENRCICFTNKNAWSTEIIIKDWIKNIYIPYFNSKNIELKNTLLIWDKATMHISFEIQRLLVKNKINFAYIPAGLTSILQPLDVSINRPYKDSIRHSYEEATIAFKSNKIPKIKREVLLKWVVENWENSIKKDSIEKSFLICGISNNLDGSEDDLFEGYKKIDEMGLVENDFTKEDLEDMNNNVSIDSSSISNDSSSDEEIDFEENK